MNKPILKMYTAFKIINTHCYLFEEFKWVSQLFLSDTFAGLHIPITPKSAGRSWVRVEGTLQLN